MKGIKYFIILYSSIFLFVFISSCKKQTDEIIQYHDPITGDYICHDTFYHSSIIEVDSVNRKYIYGINHYDSIYIIHFDFKKDSSNLLQFQSESFGLTDSLTSDFAMYSNGGHEIWHLKF
jgi:hypothetical protein